MERKAKITRAKNKKTRRGNRYFHGARLSEYRFLKLLRGYADEKPVRVVATEAKLSKKRTRELFDILRGKLMRAVMLYPRDFGWAGYFLFDGLELSRRGSLILDVVIASDLMRNTLDRHAPRSGITTQPSQRFSELVFEVTVRMFCALSMRKNNDTLYSDEIQEAYAKLQLVAIYIDQHKDQPEDPEFFQALTESFAAIMNDFPHLLAQEEFQSLVEGYRWHKHSNNLFYDNLRRYLREDPIVGRSEE